MGQSHKNPADKDDVLQELGELHKLATDSIEKFASSTENQQQAINKSIESITKATDHMIKLKKLYTDTPEKEIAQKTAKEIVDRIWPGLQQQLEEYLKDKFQPVFQEIQSATYSIAQLNAMLEKKRKRQGKMIIPAIFGAVLVGGLTGLGLVDLYYYFFVC